MTKRVVRRSDWHTARHRLLEAEKAATRDRDAVCQARLELPMREFPGGFFFDAGDVPVRFDALFDGRDQLIVYHFLLPPGAGEDHPAWRAGVDGCAFVADHFDGANQHLSAHGVSLVCVAEAPFIEFDALRRRMNWQFRCYGGSTRAFHGEVFSASGGPAEHSPGLSVFLKRNDRIYQTYTTGARGIDLLIGAYNFLDMAPFGRNETTPMNWVRFHDEY